MNSPLAATTPLSCFELDDRVPSVDEARQALLTLIEAPLGHERVALQDAHGRRLAETLSAPINVPQNTNAAMDGIALAWLAEQTRWPLAGQALAGEPFTSTLATGQCVSITTGAPLPDGADTVIMNEQLEIHADHVRVHSPERVIRGQNVRQAGEDIARGNVALAAGEQLDAARLGLAASLGIAYVAVYRRPRVAVFSTGSEVTAPGAALPAAGIYDANRFTLSGLLREHGAEVVDLGILPDCPDTLRHALEGAAASADLVLTSGGVSAGQADYTREALTALGQLAFWRVAMRPGRPLAAGALGELRTPFVGLPGNPVAAMVAFLQFVTPLLARLEGQSSGAPRRLCAIVDETLASRAGRRDFIRGVYTSDARGQLRVRSTGAQGSGILTSMVNANCLVELPDACTAVHPGETVIIQPLRREA
ncbi:MAG: molybdopterin-binding protein [Halomonas sp.]|nr:gephyrin-like molybdotransferase Glp [Halomonas sp.]MDN6297578.1 molybdopterin-binding protein [Halomonas sp.]MDN6314926.1 molybdopterin-binding protein [Halomonas sp.]MDN6336182.1 molybdopterin-binding protein [Halomonas sp.]